LTITDYFDLQN